MPGIRIGALGGFRVEVGGRSIPVGAWRQRKPAALVKLLALAPRHRLHHEEAMDALWPELAPAQAATNLRKALHYARRPAEWSTGIPLIESAGELVRASAGAQGRRRRVPDGRRSGPAQRRRGRLQGRASCMRWR